MASHDDLSSDRADLDESAVERPNTDMRAHDNDGNEGDDATTDLFAALSEDADESPDSDAANHENEPREGTSEPAPAGCCAPVRGGPTIPTKR